MEDLLTTAEVAAKLKVRPETVRSWRYTGGGPPARKVGRLVRYRQADIDAWLEQRAVVGGVA